MIAFANTSKTQLRCSLYIYVKIVCLGYRILFIYVNYGTESLENIFFIKLYPVSINIPYLARELFKARNKLLKSPFQVTEYKIQLFCYCVEIKLMLFVDGNCYRRVSGETAIIPRFFATCLISFISLAQSI